MRRESRKSFRDGVGFTGVVLSKLDGDARGGAALSITGVTERPILFASTGESLDDFERFHPDRMANRILDMGDVLSLIEQAEKSFDQEEAEKAAKKLASGEDFTLDDFLSQMQQLKNMGNIKKMLGMLPGMGQHREALDNFDESEIGHIEAIIRSMTPEERNNPKVINGSRRNRIARGSGTTGAADQPAARAVQAGADDDEVHGSWAWPAAGRPAMPGGPGMGMGKKSRGKQASPKQGKKSKSRRTRPRPPASRPRRRGRPQPAGARGQVRGRVRVGLRRRRPDQPGTGPQLLRPQPAPAGDAEAPRRQVTPGGDVTPGGPAPPGGDVTPGGPAPLGGDVTPGGPPPLGGDVTPGGPALT